ncbi:uncharacterized protein LOC110976912 isoform X1 [Acanthaster planci]|uniref:Uncharacterized protein LOC110976912 isoform X1 n=1 Tax=Acanthaster planci TaxID=133434 RepID=A0A8B7XZH6_ACAPL|nr:uncharacterized protein LOC110976912 isoform X1 [Acanthaster planci]
MSATTFCPGFSAHNPIEHVWGVLTTAATSVYLPDALPDELPPTQQHLTGQALKEQEGQVFDAALETLEGYWKGLTHSKVPIKVSHRKSKDRPSPYTNEDYDQAHQFLTWPYGDIKNAENFLDDMKFFKTHLNCRVGMVIFTKCPPTDPCQHSADRPSRNPEAVAFYQNFLSPTPSQLNPDHFLTFLEAIKATLGSPDEYMPDVQEKAPGSCNLCKFTFTSETNRKDLRRMIHLRERVHKKLYMAGILVVAGDGGAAFGERTVGDGVDAGDGGTAVGERTVNGGVDAGDGGAAVGERTVGGGVDAGDGGTAVGERTAGDGVDAGDGGTAVGERTVGDGGAAIGERTVGGGVDAGDGGAAVGERTAGDGVDAGDGGTAVGERTVGGGVDAGDGGTAVGERTAGDGVDAGDGGTAVGERTVNGGVDAGDGGAAVGERTAGDGGAVGDVGAAQQNQIGKMFLRNKSAVRLHPCWSCRCAVVGGSQ